MNDYNFKKIEPKWQKYWEENLIFFTPHPPKRKKFYCLVMFPYPSGELHMGHVRNYVIGDVIANYKRMQGFQVLHPMGWDAFGLPAENAAIKHRIHPSEWVNRNILNMKRQLKQLGISYDWTKEISTSKPEFYRWNQWFFIKMYEKGLAYREKALANWCPSCKTVLANEQVSDEGRCWRCSSEIEERKLEQWFFRITAYAEELLNELDGLRGNWPDEVLNMQRNWIGKSIGAEVDFGLEGSNEKLKIFTTRPDTLYGATFVAISPDHPMLEKITPPPYRSEVMNFARKLSSIPRKLKSTKEKEGMFINRFAINPLTGERLPIWVVDYVLQEYGTGIIMCVPAHDQRDFDFAKQYNLPIKVVIKAGEGELTEAYEGEGTMINSSIFNGLDSKVGRERVVEYLEEKNIGKRKVNYRLKDWLISRQRYWGTPIPVIYCQNCGIIPEREENLPIILPQKVKITPSQLSPLEKINEFVITRCWKCKSSAKRETDTMDTFVDSSWYYLRYIDPKCIDLPFPKNSDLWMPVDLYIGGIEHACMHLIYSRFFYKVLRDFGMVKGDEPFSKLLTQGMVTLGKSVMSKSKGNIVEPSTYIKKYGSDIIRLFILFSAPPWKQLEWTDKGIEGCQKFLNRIWKLAKKIVENKKDMNPDENSRRKLLVSLHQTIKRVSDDLEIEYQLNTAIARIMELLNELSKYPYLGDETSRETMKKLIILLTPFAPHISEEIWRMFGGGGSVRVAGWPKPDLKYLEIGKTKIIVQVDGKFRGTIEVKEGLERADVEKMALSIEKVSRHIKGEILNVVFIKDKLINFVTKR